MKSLSELAALRNKVEAAELPCDSTLIYGDGGTGKTEYAATAAESSLFDRVYWFDVANGSETVIRMAAEGRLSKKAADKISIIKIIDTPLNHIAYETITKIYTTNRDWQICEAHSRCDCPVCIKDKVTEGWFQFNYFKLGKKDLVVLDDASQYSDSILSFFCKGQPLGFKPGFNEYGPMSRILTDVLSVVQAGITNNIWIARLLVDDDNEQVNVEDKSPQKKEKMYPWVGSKIYAPTVSNRFGNKIFLKKRLGKHMGMSGSTSTMEGTVGSRIGLKVEEDIGLQSLAYYLEKAKLGKTDIVLKKT
jgi:hypothetical protein